MIEGVWCFPIRPRFFELLYEAMKKDDRIWLLVGDLGYGGADKIRKDFPDRFINCGAAEQAMLGIAAGLTYEGKIPFCYSITPFLIYRPLEFLRTYVNYEKIPIKLIGSGRDKDYAHDGFSHDASDVSWFLGGMNNIVRHVPKDKEDVDKMFQQMIEDKKPAFISLARG
jgi:transketolase